jgi:L-aspartate oxidase
MSAGLPEIRLLPRSRPSEPGVFDHEADVVVVGSGAAGISAALAAAGHGLRVLLITKEEIGRGCTPLAQGGLAAVLAPGDSAALHQQDTIEAGAGLCDPDAVAALVAGAPGEIARLGGLGARLDQESLHLEGGHSRRRIVNAGGDAVGAEVHRVLRAALLASPVEVLTRAVALDALIEEGGCGGAVGGLLVGIDDGGGRPLRQGLVAAPAVVLATGGFGQVFATTTNPAGATGDGLALAARAGAEVQDLEFVQFHPTVLWQQRPSGRSLLITEALRGAGAVLVDQAGQAVMAGRHPLGDLAPRDVVSAAMQERMASGEGPGDHLWLDATALGQAVLERDFPTVTAGCRALGIDPVREPIPVAPGAHYACGGIRADMDGRTSVPGLYAVGEVASTGVHGANRLASNSVTEALTAGRRAGDLLGRSLSRPAVPAQTGPGTTGPADRGAPGCGVPGLRLPAAGRGADPAFRGELAAAMSRQAGVLRDRDGLQQLLSMLCQAPAAPARDALDLATFETTSLHTVAVMVVTAALSRAESRGCHRWAGLPAVSDPPAQHSMFRVADGWLQVQQEWRPAGAGLRAGCAA